MRFKHNRFIALLLCVLLTAGSAIPVRASSLPEIGPGSVTTVAEEESTEENMTPAETSEENAQTEEPSVTEPEEQPTEPEETEPEEPETVRVYRPAHSTEEPDTGRFHNPFPGGVRRA